MIRSSISVLGVIILTLAIIRGVIQDTMDTALTMDITTLTAIMAIIPISTEARIMEVITERHKEKEVQMASTTAIPEE